MTAPGDRSPRRDPYVGDGADGFRRSAQIDREQADTLAEGDPVRDAALASAAAWDAAADVLDAGLGGEDPDGEDLSAVSTIAADLCRLADAATRGADALARIAETLDPRGEHVADRDAGRFVAWGSANGLGGL